MEPEQVATDQQRRSTSTSTVWSFRQACLLSRPETLIWKTVTPNGPNRTSELHTLDLRFRVYTPERVWQIMG